ncbi:MAG TPA: proton-conducting transporter membrane subunit, partial [Kineosporiaceae bacterium]|nr:proton-conducting transporter membrane subunit [Kineosporiaceae bacterium]
MDTAKIMDIVLWLPLLLPAMLAAGCTVTRSNRLTRWAPLLASGAVLACGVALSIGALSIGVTSAQTMLGAAGGTVAASGALRADALSAFLLLVVGAVGLTATWAGLAPAAPQTPPPAGHVRYGALISLFLGSMSLAVLADNLGVMWVAVEATTIATAFLVGHHGTRRALEAAWKYVVLGSVGVAIAFLGVVLLWAATRAAGAPTLSWTTLTTHPGALDPALVRVAVALMVLGLATKAGLAPMHSWLPDAHSQAPAPVSGLMSGVLLAVAFSAILRVQAVAAVVLGPTLVRALLLTAGLLSLGVAAALLLRQRDYKRMLAYSSIEHMGLMAIGAAAGGPLGLAAVLLHIFGHGLAKAALFVIAGRILAAEGSAQVHDVRALLARRPDLAVPFAAGLAALLGFPPFSLFFSEVAILLACWQRGLGWAAAIALGLLLVIFGGLARTSAGMLLGRPVSPDDP